mmetsp:Transcript_68949/g.222859  ORF Transcript_68949/g.222859 Transcript_68949/m.222859 type:complete len:433 (-) Transcript_68949:95-1393(-)
MAASLRRARPQSACPPAGVRPAGFRASPDSSAKCVLQPDLHNDAPAAQQQSRQLYRGRAAAGVGLRRNGDDSASLAIAQARHGRPTGAQPRSESVGAVLRAAEPDRPASRVSERSREPLGKACSRGHQMPSAVEQDGFRFGKPTDAPRHAWVQHGKDAIAPEAQEEDLGAHQRYVRTHNAFCPGEQVDRQYVWPAEVSDGRYRFGRPSDVRRDGAGVRAALGGGDADGRAAAGWGGEDGNPYQTKLGLAVAEDFRRATGYPLGRPPGGVHGQPPVPADFAFGAPSKAGAATAGEVIRGSYPPEAQVPDKDLGRCIREGRRNVTSENRAFGKPSGWCAGRPCFEPPPRGASAAHRSDGAAPAVAPHPAAAKGLDGSELSRPRRYDEVQSLMESAGYQLAPGEFAGLWETVARDGGEAPLSDVIKAYAARRAGR